MPYEKVGDNEPVCIADEVPFEIPESWEWVRLKNIVNVVSARRVHQSDWKSTGVPFYRAREIGKLSEQGFVNNDLFISEELYSEFSKSGVPQKNDLMITAVGTLGKVYIVKEEDRFYYKDASVICLENFGKIIPEYLRLVIHSPYLIELIKKKSAGTTVDTITIVTANEYLIPLPPQSEQQRIVCKINDCNPALDRYNANETRLSKMNKEFPELLKKSILQQAIMGKLVPQDDKDEPASVLLERIRAEKEALIKAGKLKKDKHESIIYRRDNSHYEKLDGVERRIDDEIPFDIPDSWEWVRLGSLFVLLSGTDFKPEQYNDRGDGLPYITGASNFGNHGVIINRWTEFPQVIAERGDVLLVCKGSGYGRTMICNIASAHIARQIMAFKLMKSINMNYLICFLEANYDVLKSRGQGVIPGIDRRSVLSLLFPLPPLAEQGRIIAKAVQLTKLCNLF